MNDSDWENLELVLSQRNLKLDWSFGKSASGNERLGRAPIKAGFFWKRGTQQVWGKELTRDELVTVIQRLESKGLKVPEAFREALQEFPK